VGFEASDLASANAVSVPEGLEWCGEETQGEKRWLEGFGEVG